jgi:hypothetical protein
MCRNPARSAEVEKPFKGSERTKLRREKHLCTQGDYYKECRKLRNPLRV